MSREGDEHDDGVIRAPMCFRLLRSRNIGHGGLPSAVCRLPSISRHLHVHVTFILRCDRFECYERNRCNLFIRVRLRISRCLARRHPDARMTARLLDSKSVASRTHARQPTGSGEGQHCFVGHLPLRPADRPRLHAVPAAALQHDHIVPGLPRHSLSFLPARRAGRQGAQTRVRQILASHPLVVEPICGAQM